MIVCGYEKDEYCSGINVKDKRGAGRMLLLLLAQSKGDVIKTPSEPQNKYHGALLW
jgi:hypothetical protein